MLLTTARTLFPGAMGPEGFISCFDHLMDDALLRRKLILKGGPGVGKSTMLLQLCGAISNQHTVLYITGEESVRQVKLRAFRMPGCSFWTAPRRTSPIPKFPAHGTASSTSANA